MVNGLKFFQIFRLHCLSAVSPVRTRIVETYKCKELGKGLHCLSAVSPVRTYCKVGGENPNSPVFIAFRQLVRFGLLFSDKIHFVLNFVFIAFRQLVRFGHE